jgi:murein DD-endopeptidase MepM/ murein hydrolase activator NlpD
LDHRKHLSLLVVRGDGSRLVRLGFPRRLAFVILTGVILVVAAFAVLVGDWWFTHIQMHELGDLLREVEAQRATISRLKRRMTEVQREVGSWRELHARIREPFGPDAAPPSGRGTGIGGPRRSGGAGEAGASVEILRQGPRQPPGRAGTSDELDRLAETVLQEGERLRALERLISRAGQALASLPSRWPVRGAVNSEFGGRRSPWTNSGEFHGGIDIAAERGTPIHAPAAGTVAFAGSHGEYGLTVMLDHGEDLRTIYGHLSKIAVQQGEKIARGDRLGFTGNTGRSSGPHLHYEILVQNRPVNPRAYFWD